MSAQFQPAVLTTGHQSLQPADKWGLVVGTGPASVVVKTRQRGLPFILLAVPTGVTFNVDGQTVDWIALDLSTPGAVVTYAPGVAFSTTPIEGGGDAVITAPLTPDGKAVSVGGTTGAFEQTSSLLAVAQGDPAGNGAFFPVTGSVIVSVTIGGILKLWVRATAVGAVSFQVTGFSIMEFGTATAVGQGFYLEIPVEHLDTVVLTNCAAGSHATITAN